MGRTAFRGKSGGRTFANGGDVATIFAVATYCEHYISEKCSQNTPPPLVAKSGDDGTGTNCPKNGQPAKTRASRHGSETLLCNDGNPHLSSGVWSLRSLRL